MANERTVLPVAPPELRRRVRQEIGTRQARRTRTKIKHGPHPRPVVELRRRLRELGYR